jgi:hypothetical protein
MITSWVEIFCVRAFAEHNRDRWMCRGEHHSIGPRGSSVLEHDRRAFGLRQARGRSAAVVQIAPRDARAQQPFRRRPLRGGSVAVASRGARGCSHTGLGGGGAVARRAARVGATARRTRSRGDTRRGGARGRRMAPTARPGESPPRALRGGAGSRGADGRAAELGASHARRAGRDRRSSAEVGDAHKRRGSRLARPPAVGASRSHGIRRRGSPVVRARVKRRARAR